MENLVRPQAPTRPSERLRAWIVWFGPGRLAGSVVATLVVCAGGYWLVRTPPPPTEAALPRATPSTVTSSAAADAPSIAVDGTDAGSASATSSSGASSVVVHVAGAVVAPGVHVLAPGARVADAVQAAGGPTADADLGGVNLAALVVDGVQIHVPVVGEVAAPIGGVEAVQPPPGPVDVNRATAEQLDALPGVGPATASAIVTERDRHGPFLDVDDLERVPGIGPAKVAALRDLVTT